MDSYFDMLFPDCRYQECHSSPDSSFMDWFFKNDLFIFALLDRVLHDWIIEIWIIRFADS